MLKNFKNFIKGLKNISKRLLKYIQGTIISITSPLLQRVPEAHDRGPNGRRCKRRRGRPGGAPVWDTNGGDYAMKTINSKDFKKVAILII
jgi:hypothetical protein